MNQRTTEIKQANKKAFRKHALICALSFVLGVVLGGLALVLGLERLGALLSAAGVFFVHKLAPWLLVACAILRPAICVPRYLAGKKALLAWDGEDEEALEQAERSLSVTLWINSLFSVVSYFLMAAAFSAGVLTSLEKSGLLVYIVSLMAFAVNLILGSMLERRFVDLAKLTAPEKEGSIYDLHFRKKWLDSCDEAEKITAGQCAFKSYTATNHTCTALWTVFTLSAMLFGTGFLPVLVVCIIWGVSLSVYTYWSMKLNRPGQAVLK